LKTKASSIILVTLIAEVAVTVYINTLATTQPHGSPIILFSCVSRQPMGPNDKSD